MLEYIQPVVVYWGLLAFVAGAVLAGFLGRMGRRMCNGESSHFIGEILLAILFSAATIRWGITPKLVMILSFFCILYLLSFVDIYIQEIPDFCHIIAIGIRFIYYFLFEGFQFESLLRLIAGGLLVALPLLVVTILMEKVLQKELFGGGDIKLIFVTGMYLGWELNVFMLLAACILGLVISLIQGSHTEKGIYFSFGPVIAAATVVCLFLGENSIHL